jgi:hypothetical protein
MTKYIDADARPTQYDRIRAMSVEEMAAWFLNEVPSVIDSPIWCKNVCGDDSDCPHQSECVADWLNSPSEVEA